MTAEALLARLREMISQQLPLPAAGETGERHRLLAEIAREDISLAKLAEAHWDAVAILAEAGRTATPGVVYGVWASKVPGKQIRLGETIDGYCMTGEKPFCSGVGLVDRALVTVGLPEQYLVEVDLRRNTGHIQSDLAIWKVDAFRSTQTGALVFDHAELNADAVVGPSGWYLDRPGFWHGACGPAACWAGGVAGLVDFALSSKRDDPHTLAHLAAMRSSVWGMYALLKEAGREIDADPCDMKAAQIRAMQLRYLIEEMATEILHRFSRAYGPHPLAMNEEIARRFQEANLYMRQSHGERDLESLAHLIR